MKVEQNGKSPTRRQDLREGFGLARCSKLECSQVLFEESQVYWNQAPRRLICNKCKNEVVFQGTEFSSHPSDQIIYIYWCHLCKEEYFLTIPLGRKYCSVCKVTRYRSWSFHLRAPLPPHDPSNSCAPLTVKDSAL